MKYTKEEFDKITSMPCKSFEEVVEREQYIYEYWNHNNIDVFRSTMQAEWFGIKGYAGGVLRSAEEIVRAIAGSPKEKPAKSQNMRDLKIVIEKLRSLTKYDMQEDGCDCCGRFISSVEDDDGEWVKYKDLQEIIDEIEKVC